MSPRLSIVIPAFNESARLPTTLAALILYVDGHDMSVDDVEIVVVDDASHDGTAATARRILASLPHQQVLQLPKNRGKGGAVRAGVLAATGDVIVFMDADLATDLAALDDLLAALDVADIAIGSRAIPGSAVHRDRRTRAWIARICRLLVRLLTRVRVADTQCGFKAFPAPIGKLLFALSRCDGFSFDVEVLDLAAILGYSVVEVPVDWTAVEGSNVRIVRDPIVMTFDLVQLAIRDRDATMRQRARELGWTPPGAFAQPVRARD